MMHSHAHFDIPLALVYAGLLLTAGIFAAVRLRRRGGGETRPQPASGSRAPVALIIALFVIPLALLALFLAAAVFFIAPQRDVVGPAPSLTWDTAPPSAVPETAIVPPRDFERWLEADAIAPPRERPAWVENAGGSIAVSETAFGLEVRGRRPGPDGLLAGYSDLCQETEEALEAARRSAAEHVAAFVVATARRLPADPSGRALLPERRLPKKLVLESLAAFRPEILEFVAAWTKDRFVEEIAKPYGTLRRAAILVSVDSKEVLQLAARFGDVLLRRGWDRSESRREVLIAVAAALGMAVAVFLLYSFLNAGTKGYFAWPLRIVSIGTLLAMYLGLMYALDWFPG
ncbi:MAG: hypothetical protein ACUVYA_07590 [Planctomycetota bacterium]